MFITNVRTICVNQVKRPLLNPFKHQYSSLFFIFEGRGVLHVDNLSYPCQKNDCFFVPDFERVACDSAQGSLVTLLQVVLDLKSKEMADQLRLTSCRLAAPGPLVRSAVLSILNEFSLRSVFFEDAVNFQVVKILFHGIVGGRSCDAAESSTDNISESEGDADPAMHSILRYIDSHLADDISVDELTRLTGISPRLINKLFRRYYGCTAQQHISRARLAKSKELLCFSDLSITEISQLTGFRSIHYFSRYFKEKEKIAPQEYKRSVDGCMTSHGLEEHLQAII